ncbi:hypothetical protein FJTKL_02235 [Diaporthe vaccinii]|uniref:Secreted protein n=1 Tax=Diaporthe vaccinii TaxID=105482 RepID=A0ABR4F3E1_9PEZI
MGKLTDELHVVVVMLMLSILCEWSRNLMRGPEINQRGSVGGELLQVSSSLGLQEVGGRACVWRRAALRSCPVCDALVGKRVKCEIDE